MGVYMAECFSPAFNYSRELLTTPHSGNVFNAGAAQATA